MMIHPASENSSSSFTVTEMPLSDADKRKLKKIIRSYYWINWLLIPLWILVFFWGIWYFIIFGVFSIWYNLFAVRKTQALKRELNNPKLIITGLVTDIQKKPSGDGYSTTLLLGKEAFDISYEENDKAIKTGDSVSLHYSMKENGSKGWLLAIC